MALTNQAQTASTGALIGAVTDQTGSVLQDAEITITNQATGDVRRVKTDGNGDYRVPLLPPVHIGLKQ
jgi:hypothetical protein